MRYVKTAGSVLLWIVQIFSAAGFIMVGTAKFWSPFWIALFVRWGLPDWFRGLTGVLEITGGAALLLPRTASYGASLIGVIMTCAAALQVIHEGRRQGVAPLVWAVIMVLIAYSRYRRAWRPSSQPAPAARTAGIS